MTHTSPVKATYPLVLKLKYPVEYGQELITELHLRRPKGREFRTFNLEHTTMGDMLNLLAKLTNQPPSVIDEMDMEDIQTALESMGELLPGSRPTLTTP